MAELADNFNFSLYYFFQKNNGGEIIDYDIFMYEYLDGWNKNEILLEKEIEKNMVI